MGQKLLKGDFNRASYIILYKQQGIVIRIVHLKLRLETTFLGLQHPNKSTFYQFLFWWTSKNNLFMMWIIWWSYFNQISQKNFSIHISYNWVQSWRNKHFAIFWFYRKVLGNWTITQHLVNLNSDDKTHAMVGLVVMFEGIYHTLLQISITINMQQKFFKKINIRHSFNSNFSNAIIFK